MIRVWTKQCEPVGEDSASIARVAPASRKLSRRTFGRIGRLPVIATGVALIAGCGEGTTEPRAQIAGRYELVTVDDRPLPFRSVPSTGLDYDIPYGELLLRIDGTFGFGAGILFTDRGSYTRAGDSLSLEWSELDAFGEPIRMTGSVTGDRIVLQVMDWRVAPRYGFRRSVVSQPAVTEGLYTLASINGQGPPFVLEDGRLAGHPWFVRVAYDSIAFSEGVFFRRGRGDETGYVDAAGDTLLVADEYWGHGSIRPGPSSNTVILRRYWADPNFRDWADTMVVSGGALLHEVLGSSDADTLELRYERER